MKRAFLTVGLLLLLGCRATAPSAVGAGQAQAKTAGTQRDATANVPGQFDFYLLNLSWSPEFCHSHPSAPECSAHSTFVLHGLWPEFADGSYPKNCSNASGPADPTKYLDIYPDPSLLQHEWQTHGTCSGLAADAFFTAARTAFHAVTIPPQFNSLSSQISLAPDDILGQFTATNPGIPRSSLTVTCGNNYLTAVEVCLDKSLQPTACAGLTSCRANVVRIPAP